MSPDSRRHLRALPDHANFESNGGFARDDDERGHHGSRIRLISAAERHDPAEHDDAVDRHDPAERHDDDADQWAAEVLTQLAPWTMGPHPLLRIALAIAAFVQLAVALPWLVAADPAGLMDGATEAHLTRDGALGLAVAVAAGLTVWRSRYAIAASLVGFAIVTAQLITAIVDDHFQRVSLRAELAHGWTLVIVIMLALCARPRRDA